MRNLLGVHRWFITTSYTVHNVASSEGGCGLAANSDLGKLWKLLRIIGAVVLAAVVVAVLFKLLNWYVAPTKPSERKDLVLALAQILGGVALLSGLYVTWRTLQVNREGQITERFTRAIEQLGSTQLEIRLGGIYALERIARDSEQDYWAIMEVLTAYVREHAPRWPELRQGSEESATVVQNSREDDSRTPSKLAMGLLTRKPDIQAVMFVLRRRIRSFDSGEPNSLELPATNLPHVYLANADLTGAVLWKANLSEAFLPEASLRGTLLVEADLTGANLTEADLTGADLRKITGLTDEQLEQAIGDKTTKLPDHVKRPASWSK